MLHVLRHYFPIRKAALVLTEMLLLSAVLAAGMTTHLWNPSVSMRSLLALEDLSVEGALNRCLLSAFLLAAVSQIAISFNELYDFRVTSSRYERASRFVESAGTSLAFSLGLVVMMDLWGLQQVIGFPGLKPLQAVQTLTFTQLFGFGVLYIWRNVFHSLLRAMHLDERALILGTGSTARELAREMIERSDSGYEVVGLLSTSDDPSRAPRDRSPKLAVVGGEVASAPLPSPYERPISERDLALTDPLVLSPLDIEASSEQLHALVQENHIDVIVVALSDRRKHLPTDALLLCRLDGTAVSEQEALYEQITGKIAVTALRPSYLIFNQGFRQHPWKELLKRSVDIVLSLVILLFTWPFMIATAIAVKQDSPGGAIFSQERVGKNGKPFTLLKFRSMRSDAEKASGPVWASEDDPRITRIGRFIRKTRLDELPQIFNVLSGSMSLIGPRPERPHFVEDLSRQIPYFNQRHIMKPGLTGWAQINYPYGNTVEDSVQKLQYDLFYIKNQSFLFDLSILFNTIKTVLLRQGT